MRGYFGIFQPSAVPKQTPSTVQHFEFSKVIYNRSGNKGSDVKSVEFDEILVGKEWGESQP